MRSCVGLLGLGLGVVGVEVNGDRGDGWRFSNVLSVDSISSHVIDCRRTKLCLNAGGPVASHRHFADSQYLGGGVGPGCHTLGDLGNSGHVRLPPQDLRYNIFSQRLY